MRSLYSILIIVTFGVIQFIGVPLQIYFAITNPDADMMEIIKMYMPYQFGIYVFGLIVVLILGNIHKNKNMFELGKKSTPLMTIVWVFGGLALAFVAQFITATINIKLLGNPEESANTQLIMEMITAMPYMALFVAIIGPIIEEYVFRRAIFAEIYERLPMNRVVSFLITGLISGLIFAVAHFDFTHILVYLGMSYVFSFVYVMTNRLLVPILVHMLMNGTVVAAQVFFKDAIENLEQLQSNIILIGKVFMSIL